MIVGTYRELFAAIAAAAGSLTGLLFVAISVTPARRAAQRYHVVQDVRAAAALLAFNNALAVSLYGLVPGTNVGYPATALGVVGILFVAASMRSIRSSDLSPRIKSSQLGLACLLLLIFGTELVCGIFAIAHPRQGNAEQLIGYALVTSLIVGVARAWELVSGRDTGVSTSIALLLGRAPHVDSAAALQAVESDEPDNLP